MVHFRQCSPGCSECPHTVRGSCPVLYLDSEPFIRPRMSRTVFCMSRIVNNRKSLFFEYLKPLTVTKRLQKRLQMFVTYQAMPKPILGMCNIPYCTVNRGPRTPPKLPRATVQENQVTVFWHDLNSQTLRGHIDLSADARISTYNAF